MPRLILLLVLGVIAYLVYRRLQSIPPGQRKSTYLKIGLGALVALVIFGTVTGRMHWLGAVFTALLVGLSRGLPMLARLFPMLQWLHGQRSSAQQTGGGQQSTVDSDFLHMVLDHGSGDMNGEVLKGDFTGRSLDDLNRVELDQLLTACIQHDQDSARLLETYLARRFGEESDRQQTTGDSNGMMTRQEALAILGLEDNANESDIVETHRRLMQKLHPDRGGSDYLAAKLNQAKDTLLG